MTAEEKRIIEELERRVRELEDRAANSDHADEMLRRDIAELRKDFNVGIAQLHSKYDAHEKRSVAIFKENNKENRKLIWAMILILASLAGLQKLPELLQLIP